MGKRKPQTPPVTAIVLRNGRGEAPMFNMSDAEQFARVIGFIAQLRGRGVYRVDVKRVRNQRSGKQNAYYWGVVLPYLAKGMRDAWGEDVNSLDAHEFSKDRWLKLPIVDKRTGVVVGQKARSTTDLDTAEFASYLDEIIRFAADYLQTEIPPACKYVDPGDERAPIESEEAASKPKISRRVASRMVQPETEIELADQRVERAAGTPRELPA